MTSFLAILAVIVYTEIKKAERRKDGRENGEMF